MASTPLETAFGQVIRELRLRAGLSQEALSFACSRHRTYISLIERGQNAPSITTVWLLASALDVHPTTIVDQVEQRLRASEDGGGHPVDDQVIAS